MKRFVITVAILALFALILLVAATAQNQGCPPWKDPVTIGGGVFSDERGETLCR